MKVCDLLAEFIKREAGVVFGVTGGCVVSIFDALFKHDVKIVPVHHEQAAAMAADGFARVSGKVGVCVATSGPGGQNLLTGVACAYYDSTPLVAITGQVPSAHIRQSDVRQIGFQESPNGRTLGMCAKLHSEVTVPEGFETVLSVSFNEAVSDRPGPCVIDICDDVQRMEAGKTLPYLFDYMAERKEASDFSSIQFALQRAKRPVLILGAGVHAGHLEEEARNFVSRHKIPVLLSWGALDLLGHNDPLNCRDFGVTSQRIGNFVLGAADTIIVVGSRLDTHMVGNCTCFAPDAHVCVVDIDKAELDTRDYYAKVHCDAREFFDQSFEVKDYSDWLNNIQDLRAEYAVTFSQLVLSDPYCTIELLCKIADSKAIIISDAGQTVTWTMQQWKVKLGQRLFTAFNHSPMGYALPAAIGAHYAAPNRQVLAITGDGGLMMNLQELQTVAYNKLPIKIIVMDNNGYGMIRQTQSDWPALSQGVACGGDGLGFPNWKKISEAFGICYVEIDDPDLLSHLRDELPVLVHCSISESATISPKLKFGDAFYNQKPYLPQNKIDAIFERLTR